MPNILSIQSHVAFGYVGNRAAVFPLELLGHEVYQINTVQFSNHTGYGQYKGMVFPVAHVKDVYFGIKEIADLANCDAVLSGYIGDVSIAEFMVEVVQEIKKINKNALYCFDPVMGDVGRNFYVKPEIVTYFQQRLIGYCDIITPNHFEASVLVGFNIQSYEDAKKACKILHDKNIKNIVITSLLVQETKEKYLDVFLSCAGKSYVISTPNFAFNIVPSGTGDLFSSLFLATFLSSKNILLSLKRATECTYGILLRTFDLNKRELQIISAQNELINPSSNFAIIEL